MNTQDAAAVVVIFGAAGDLTRRKLLPALYNLFLDRQLPERFAILGLDRIALDDEAFPRQIPRGRGSVLASRRVSAEAWVRFAPALRFTTADFSELLRSPGILRPRDRLASIERPGGRQGPRVFYLATPPTVVEAIVRGLGDAGLGQPRERSRIVVEKPFGRNLSNWRRQDVPFLPPHRQGARHPRVPGLHPVSPRPASVFSPERRAHLGAEPLGPPDPA
jgi:glucose-6-phosphate 1-dehydrogenase